MGFEPDGAGEHRSGLCADGVKTPPGWLVCWPRQRVSSAVLVARRRLAARPAEELLTEAGIAGMLDALGLARDDETAAELAVELRQLAATRGAVGMLIGAFAAADRRDLPHGWMLVRGRAARAAARLDARRALLIGEAAGANGSGRRGALRASSRRASRCSVQGVQRVCSPRRRVRRWAVDLSADIGRRSGCPDRRLQK